MCWAMWGLPWATQWPGQQSRSIEQLSSVPLWFPHFPRQPCSPRLATSSTSGGGLHAWRAIPMAHASACSAILLLSERRLHELNTQVYGLLMVVARGWQWKPRAHNCGMIVARGHSHGTPPQIMPSSPIPSSPTSLLIARSAHQNLVFTPLPLTHPQAAGGERAQAALV